ncbi:MAG: GNAT family N-acetyltransferase [Pseudomonadota bacterium]
MSAYPAVGRRAIRASTRESAWHQFSVRVVRDLADYQMAVAIRAAAFMSEQSCPFDEEYDGNDLTATHLLAFQGDSPVATLRLRWFAGFGKVERVCVLKQWRGSEVIKVLLAHAFEISARKGYRRMIAQIQARLWPVWSRMLNCSLREDRQSFSFSDYDYREIDIPLPAHPKALRPDTDPYVIIRPEGDWDRRGVLERSVEDEVKETKAA